MSIDLGTNRPILIVDDEKNYRIILSRILEAEGYQVLTADRSQAAMSILRKQPVALILTDLHMPGVDGLELCHRVSRDIGQIPFILFSAFFSTRHRQEIDATVDAWGGLCKPFNNGEDLSLVKDVLAASASGQKFSRDSSRKRVLPTKIQTNEIAGEYS